MTNATAITSTQIRIALEKRMTSDEARAYAMERRNARARYARHYR